MNVKTLHMDNYTLSQDSKISPVTRLLAVGPRKHGSILSRVKKGLLFSKASRLAPRPDQLPLQWVKWLQWLRYEVKCSIPSCAKVTNAQNYTSSSPYTFMTQPNTKVIFYKTNSLHYSATITNRNTAVLKN